jgi:hypothetical protein
MAAFELTGACETTRGTVVGDGAGDGDRMLDGVFSRDALDAP